MVLKIKDFIEILTIFDFKYIEREEIEDPSHKRNLYGCIIYPSEVEKVNKYSKKLSKILYDRGEILIIKDLTPVQQRKTIIHEFLHAYSYLHNLKWDEREVEERTNKLYNKLYKNKKNKIK